MTRELLVSCGGGKCQIMPLHSIPEDKERKNIIDFDPIEQFGQDSVEMPHLIKVCARDNSLLPAVKLPLDPNDSS